MPFPQFTNSLRSIWANPHINRGVGIARHLHWQYRKAVNAFPFEQRISSSRILAHHRRCGVSALIYSQGLYNYNNMRLLRRLLEGGGVFFDIGANIGSYTLVASESDRALVFAFEPHPVTFHYLSQNVELNRRGNVILLNIALGDHDGQARLTDEAGSATNHIATEAATAAIPVICRRIDSYCDEHGVTPAIVKIDVEGFEYGVLEGFGRYRRSLGVVFVEMNGLADARSRGQADIHQLLTEDGLRGPYSCNFDMQRFQKAGWSAEDSIYLSESLCETLRGMGFQIETPA